MSAHGFTAPATGTRKDAAKASAGTASNELLMKLVRRQNDITTLLAQLVDNLTTHVMVRGGEDWSTSSPYESDFQRVEKLTGEVEDVISELVNDGEVHPATLQRIEIPLP